MSPSSFHYCYPLKLPQKNAFYEEPWDIPEDNYLINGAKKMRTVTFPLKKELSEYSLSDLEQEKRVFLDRPEAFDKNFEYAVLRYKQISDQPTSFTLTCGESNDHCKPSYDDFSVCFGSLQSNIVERKRFSQELDQPSFEIMEKGWDNSQGWNTSMSCSLVSCGKVLNMMLPEFLDCTSMTSLDMFSKHYYQAYSAWVVFFVPESDADMRFYNEFMNYLGEKQQVIVAKLDDATTLFLVPLSNFYEKSNCKGYFVTIEEEETMSFVTWKKKK